MFSSLKFCQLWCCFAVDLEEQGLTQEVLAAGPQQCSGQHWEHCWMWGTERENQDQRTNPWWANGFQCLWLSHLPSSVVCRGWNEMGFNDPPDTNHSMLLWSSRTQTPGFGRAARPTTPDCTGAMCSVLELSSTTAKLGSAG